MRRYRVPFYKAVPALAFSILTVAPVVLAAVDTSKATIKTLPKSNLIVEDLAIDPSTGNPDLVRFLGGRSAPGGTDPETKALSLFDQHAHSFGLSNPKRELEFLESRRDPIGGEQAVFRQVYRGVPVFGSVIRVHFDSADSITTINGTVISDIDLDPIPFLDAHVAEDMARRLVAKQRDLDWMTLEIEPAGLMIYREGFVEGRPGVNHLAWEVLVASRPDLREVLYIDAHDGRLIDQRSDIHQLHRVIHRRHIPGQIWAEGDTRPYDSGNSSEDAEINELIDASGDAYTLFANMTNGGYLSFDGEDAVMNSVYDSDSINCPNAVESGGVTAYCVGMVSDDVSAHEWAHAYTAWTHNLVYQWQPGALNEAYSDIFGELVDQLNGRGFDSPGGVRPTADCSATGGNPQPTLDIDSPSSIAGPYASAGAVFNPLPSWTIAGPVELIEDEVGTPTDGCEPIVGFSPGSIALIDRGECPFREKVINAQSVGATGVIVVNNQGNDIFEMGGDLPRLDTPAVFIGQNDGDLIKASLAQGVTATLTLDGDFSDSVRWLIGEDTSELGPIRDMWSPACFGDPGRVGSINYHCNQTDNGGVHTNSGIPNHAFALLIDGGSYNGFQIQAIGSNKAARIYWRAMSVYQTPVSGFRNHADLIETSCQDLIGMTLYDLETGAVAAETISAADCVQVAAAMDAVEMRLDPSQCNFELLLDPDAPGLDANLVVFSEDFDVDPDDRWALSNRGLFPEYEPRDWVWTEEPPPGAGGSAFFAIDSVLIGDCRAGSDDQTGVMELTSPSIILPLGTASPILTFDHWVATEPGWDGGNLKISVNDGPFSQVSPDRFLFNPYNDRIESQNTNPLAGEWAYTGTNDGTLNGSWGQSQIALDTIAQAGDRIVLRFDFGVDGCNGAEGWYLDNVEVLATAVSPRRAGGRVSP